MVGASHKTASLAVLERIAVREHNRGALLSALRAAGCSEAVVLSTCSRTEIYAVIEDVRAGAVLEALARVSGLRYGELGGVTAVREGDEAVAHLFRVAAGLDSRIIGEVEIQDQVRAARVEAGSMGMVGPLLQQLFVQAVGAARRIHEETVLGRCGRSIGRRAAEIAMADLSGRHDLVVAIMGSGRMATVVAERLTELGVHPVSYARSRAKAIRLVSDEARAYPIEALGEALERIDVLFCTTSASDHLVRAGDVRDALTVRNGRPLTVVDLSVPRNVESSVGSMSGVRLIDLEGIEEHTAQRQALHAVVARGEAIVAEETALFSAAWRARGAGPVIMAMRNRVERVCLEELQRAAGDGQGLDPEEMRRAANAIAAKLLHAPILAARQAAATNDRATMEQLCRLFRIDPPAAPARVSVPDASDRRCGRQWRLLSERAC
jgi:glutamyl-tRNA reductase